jgi:hypothetical protein
MQGMVFYSLAAESHYGQDGHRRKGILHYQAPPPFYPQTQQPGHPISNYQTSPTTSYNPAAQYNPAPPSGRFEPVSHLAPIPGQYGGSYNIGTPALPEPADFANAGPPGYQYWYEPEQSEQQTMSYAESQYHPAYQTHAPSQPDTVNNGQRRSIGSSDNHLAQYHNGAVAQTRSEWSSPVPGYPAHTWYN